MEERDHYLSKQYHRELLDLVDTERLVRNATEHSPSQLDHLLDWSGNLLISLGQRLKSHATTTPDLSEECA
jgi:hypothetical protein